MAGKYPFAKELIKDDQGRVTKVVLPVDDYRRLIDTLEDEGLLRAMKEVQDEPSLSLEEAVAQCESDEDTV